MRGMAYSRSPKVSQSDRGAPNAIEGFPGGCGGFYFEIASGWFSVGLPKDKQCAGSLFC